MLAFGCEAGADNQLAVFRHEWHRRRTRGEVVGFGICATKLWSISRHPNYVGHFFCCVAYAMYGYASATQSWHGYMLLGLPVFAYFKLMYWSGVPMNEYLCVERRGDLYRNYVSNVAIVPSAATLARHFFPGATK